MNKFLLNCGAEKAGTTWLYNYFLHHPQYYTIGKELNLLQRNDLVPFFHSELTEYRSNLNKFFQYISTLNRVTGDFTHYEGSTPNVFRIFKEGLGKYDIDIVPVYIMRDPIQRAWSAWNMIGGGNVSMAPAAKFVMENFLACKYRGTILSLDSIFPNTLYFFYEDFFEQSNLDLICDRLEIQRQDALFEYVNKGKYTEPPPAEFVRMFGKSRKNLEAVNFIRQRFSNVPWNFSDYA